MSEALKNNEKLEVSEFIPIFNLKALRNKIADLNKRADKLKLPPIVIAYGEKKTVEKKIYDMSMNITMVKCTITGEYPRLPGYSFLAKLEKKGERNLVLGAKGSIDESWITKDGLCDHCKSKRDRKETFIIKNDETGEILQIGSSCIDSFIGSSSIDGIAFRATLYSIFDDEGLFNYGDEDVKLPKIVATEDFIAASLAAIRKFGFLSKSSSEASLKNRPTAILAFDRLIPIFKEEDRVDFTVADSDFEYARLAIENMDDLLSTVENQSLKANIKTLCVSPDLHFDNIYTAVLLAKLAIEHDGGSTEFKNKMVKQEPVAGFFLGGVGEKITALVSVQKKMNFDSAYNRNGVNMIIMTDENGNTLVTTTSGSFNPSIGSIIQIKATVKQHKSYKGINQTILQRVSITKCATIEAVKEKLKGQVFSEILDTKKTSDKWEGSAYIYLDLTKFCESAAPGIRVSLDHYHVIHQHGGEQALLDGKDRICTLEIWSDSSFKESVEFFVRCKDRGEGRIETQVGLIEDKKKKK